MFLKIGGPPFDMFLGPPQGYHTDHYLPPHAPSQELPAVQRERLLLAGAEAVPGERHLEDHGRGQLFAHGGVGGFPATFLCRHVFLGWFLWVNGTPPLPFAERNMLNFPLLV